MAEVRNVFVKSKMNKDLDERLLPNGEYRDGQNISVNKSEGPDEGVVENIIGNNLYSNFNFGTNVEIIGSYVDTDRDRIFLFATNHSDSSPSQLDSPAVGSVDTASGRLITSAVCVIAYIEGPTASSNNNPKWDKLVEGPFLNFSKTHPMHGVDMIEDLLFFTDNRNQPRKINVETAIANPLTYYTHEDHISVSKLSPVSPINFIYQVGGAYISGLMDETSEYLPANSIGIFANSSSGAGTATMTANIPQLAASLNDKVRFKNLNFPELGYFKMKTFTSNSPAEFTYEYPIGSNNNAADSYAAALEAAKIYQGSNTNTPPDPTRFPFAANDVLQFERENPVYNASYSGDKDYLKNKFVRFSYRFKFDDGEFSLMAPFTQHAFVPKQYGYFLDSAAGDGKLKRDEKNTAESGINKLMENQVTSAKFRLELPWKTDISPSRLNTFKNDFKVESIQILLKESDGLAIKVVDEIDVDENDSWYGSQTATNGFYEYDYKSEKPFKVLPDADATRVHDKVPIRALAQAVTSNRVVYGNFIEKHESPEYFDYDISIAPKPDSSTTSFDQKEYPNNTLKQNRSYKVGVVLIDRYGRSSNVVLRNPILSTASGEFASIYSPYMDLSSTLNWPGNNLQLLFTSLIPEAKTTTGYPGVWSTDNPLGFYSYKIVVQQKQQEYYNVYVPGACSGKIVFNKEVGSSDFNGGLPSYERANSVSNIVLYGDNINKVPKELADVGPTEEIYGSETLLYPRVVTRYIVDSTNDPAYTPVLSSTESSQIRELNEFTVTSIVSFNDLGSWTAGRNKFGENSSYPNDGAVSPDTKYIDPLYLDSSSNPFVAQLATSFLVGFAPIVQEGQGSTPPILRRFSKNLNVFETDPVISEIDIFWESSSAGRIYTLNSEINSGTAGLPTSITDPNLVMVESITPGTSSWVSDTFTIIDDTGSPLTGATATMSVTNGNNANIDMFEIVESPAAPAYKIRYNPTDSSVYYGSDSALRTFNFNITSTKDNSSTTSTHQMLLSNVKPSLTSIPISGAGTLNGGSGVVMLFVGDNGATTGNSGSWDTPFYIQTTTLPNDGQGFPGCEVIRLNQYADVINGSGSTVSGVNQLEVSIANIAGSVNSQRLFTKTTDAPHTTWTITDNNAELISLKSAPGDPEPGNPGSAVYGKFLLKINVVDAGGVGQGTTTTYSSWFQIII